jgi:hypothetical protein
LGNLLKDLARRSPRTKGWGAVAYPSRYGISGRTSFLVGQQGIVYSGDPGEKTELLASRIKEFDSDASWRPFSGLPTHGRAVKVVTTNE